MTNTNELLRLLRKQAEYLQKGEDVEAKAIQRSLELRFADVWCMACGHQAIRHTVALTDGDVGDVIRQCAGEPMKDEACNCPVLTFAPASREIVITRFIKPRPVYPRPTSQDVPAHWLIFNAPRPLHGTRFWEGDFYHGIYYAAVDPADSLAATMIDSNAGLDGWLVQYVTMDDVRAWVKRQTKAEGITDEDLAEMDDEHLQDWYVMYNKRVRGQAIAIGAQGWRAVAFDELKLKIDHIKELLMDGHPEKALELLQSFYRDAPERALWDLKKAVEGIEAGNPAADCIGRLDAAVKKIGFCSW